MACSRAMTGKLFSMHLEIFEFILLGFGLLEWFAWHVKEDIRLSFCLACCNFCIGLMHGVLASCWILEEILVPPREL